MCLDKDNDCGFQACDLASDCILIIYQNTIYVHVGRVEINIQIQDLSFCTFYTFYTCQGTCALLVFCELYLEKVGKGV